MLSSKTAALSSKTAAIARLFDTFLNSVFGTFEIIFGLIECYIVSNFNKISKKLLLIKIMCFNISLRNFVPHTGSGFTDMVEAQET